MIYFPNLVNEKIYYSTFYRAAENYFIKYGEISYITGRAEHALMKQKHRMMWERRHGPVGTGMKTESEAVADE